VVIGCKGAQKEPIEAKGNGLNMEAVLSSETSVDFTELSGVKTLKTGYFTPTALRTQNPTL
jgi:hypothetical protein